MMQYVVGVDIGGTKCAVALGIVCREAGEIYGFRLLDRNSFATAEEAGPEEVLSRLVFCVRRMIKGNRIAKGQILGTGICCGGPLDHRTGMIQSPPNLPGWHNVPVVRRMEEELGIPAFLQNDANACALAEWRFGAGRGCQDMVFLTCGTGMGAGLILRGRLYCGSGDMAGEAGHIRLNDTGPVGYGKEGSFEGFCSGGGIARLARKKIQEKIQVGDHPVFCPEWSMSLRVTAQDVAKAARAGDLLALEIFGVVGEYLGRGLAILIDLLNPEAIVLGSIYQRCEDLLAERVREVVRREALAVSAEKCRILPAGLGDKIGDYAAFTVAACGGDYDC